MNNKMNNTKTEFIKLIEFKESIEDRLRRTESLIPDCPLDDYSIKRQVSGYRAIIWEIDKFMIEWMDRENELLYEYDMLDRWEYDLIEEYENI